MGLFDSLNRFSPWRYTRFFYRFSYGDIRAASIAFARDAPTRA